MSRSRLVGRSLLGQDEGNEVMKFVGIFHCNAIELCIVIGLHIYNMVLID